MTINEIEQQIIDEFAVFDNWMDKYEYIIDLGKELTPIKEEEKIDDNLINGCQSRVWLTCKEEEGRLYFAADSDAIITKGIISLLIRVFNGQTAQNITNADLEFINSIGLRANLSPTRANGLVAMIAKIRQYAQEHLSNGDNRKKEEYSKIDVQKNLIRALKQVYDPDIQVNVYDLGLIYEIDVTENNAQVDLLYDVYIKMSLTSPTCPIADDIVRDVENAVRDVPGVKDVRIELTFEPEWGIDRMSDEAKLELGLL